MVYIPVSYTHLDVYNRQGKHLGIVMGLHSIMHRIGAISGSFLSLIHIFIDLLRQRSRPSLFSNSLAPVIIGASLEVFKMLKEKMCIRDRYSSHIPKKL